MDAACQRLLPLQVHEFEAPLGGGLDGGRREAQQHVLPDVFQEQRHIFNERRPEQVALRMAVVSMSQTVVQAVKQLSAAWKMTNA